jgi:hypothetical protein
VNGSTNTVYAADELTQAINIYGVAEPPPPPKTEPELPELPDKRAWQLVTPALKHGAGIFPNTGDAGLVQASEDGSAITYTSNAPIVPEAPSNRGPEPTVNLSRRGAGGWSTQDLSTPRIKPIGYTAGQGTEWRFFSNELEAGIVTPAMGAFEAHEAPLSPAESETTFYLRDLTRPAGACEPTPSTCYQPLVSSLNTTAVGYGDKFKFLTASPNAQHALFFEEEPIALTSEAPEGPHPIYEWSQGEHGGLLQQVNTPPPGEPGAGAEAKIGEADVSLRELGNSMRHAINNSGSRVVWAANGKLFVRDTSRNETLRIDLPEEGVPAAEEPEAVFRIADAEGNRIFFTDEAALTKNSTSEAEAVAPAEGQSDLYVCEIVEHEGKLACALQDLTTTVTAPKEAAAVQNVVGASEDGTYVYFVADGALAPGAGRGHCNEVTEEEETLFHKPATSCNLYVSHLGGKGWEKPRFITKLTTADRPDWQAANARHGLTSRVSTKGQFLAFMSNSSLTGYNNVDAVSGAHDQELYLYHYNENPEKDTIACASCNPTGAQPHGVLDQIHSGEGNGLVIDRPFLWEGQTLAGDIPGWVSNQGEFGLYLPRNLNENGRLFFNSPDALVPADKNGKMDVYEFEPQNEGGCKSATGCVALISSGTSEQESAFVDASASGEDAFIYSNAKLQPTIDSDGAYDIYDAQVCRPGAECINPAPVEVNQCESEGTCKGNASEVPALPPAAPTSAASAGNKGTTVIIPPPTVVNTKHVETNIEKLEKALKKCRTKHNKKKRKACEKQARKQFPVKKAKKTARKARRAHR